MKLAQLNTRLLHFFLQGREAVELLWVSLSLTFSALEGKLCVQVVTGCIIVPEHTVNFIRCEIFVVGCSCCYCR